MPQITVDLDCPVFDSFRVQQVGGLFDVAVGDKAHASFAADVPGEDEPWDIGVIVGPSGSGKSTIASAAFGDRLYRSVGWPDDRAVIDGFGELSTKAITKLLTAVGFSSPPAWVKPYRVLSGGERFRCDLARAISAGAEAQETGVDRDPPIVAFDEFTSVVDRNVAQVGSVAVSKAIRGGAIRCRFVAVTCHYDVVEWLEPDWVVDMATRSCQRRRLRRPKIELEVFRCGRRVWDVFAPHHYLSGTVSKSARCWLARWRGNPVSFCATIPMIGRRGHWRISRIVTLPDYQGVGIGTQMAEAVASIHREQGHRVSITGSHPALIAHCRRSPLWRTVRVVSGAVRRATRLVPNYRTSSGRAVVSFEYAPAAAE